MMRYRFEDLNCIIFGMINTLSLSKIHRTKEVFTIIIIISKVRKMCFPFAVISEIAKPNYGYGHPLLTEITYTNIHTNISSYQQSDNNTIYKSATTTKNYS